MIDEGGDIATSFSVRDRFSWCVGFLVFTLMFATPPLLVFMWLYLNTPSGRPPAWAYAVAYLFGAGVSLWVVRGFVSPLRWRLTDSELIGGLNGEDRYPLSSIEKIVVGLPDLLSGSPKAALVNPVRLATYSRARENALLLIFQDGSLLPLSLHRVMNGPLLKFRLTERLKDRVVHNYSYSENELRLLKRAEPNRLIPRPVPPSPPV